MKKVLVMGWVCVCVCVCVWGGGGVWGEGEGGKSIVTTARLGRLQCSTSKLDNVPRKVGKVGLPRFNVVLRRTCW